MAKRLNLNTGLMEIAARGLGMRAISEDEILSIAYTILSIREEISELYEQIASNTLFSMNEEAHRKAGKNQRRRVNGWAFYPLKEFLTYKALQAGIPLSCL